MLLSRASIVLIVCLQFYRTHQASNYVAYLSDVAVDCPGKKQASLSKYFDSTNVDFEYTENEGIILKGHTQVFQDFERDQKMRFKVTVLKYINGQLINTMFSVDRNDVCAHLMDVNETWYSFLSHFEGDQRSCPPRKGVILPLPNKVVGIHFSAPSVDIEGRYRMRIDIDFKEDDLTDGEDLSSSALKY